MKHARPDYDAIQDPRGLIPEDEPVFLLRGQDRFAAATMRFYADLCRDAGVPAPLVEGHIAVVEAWPKKKTPDGPGGEGSGV